MDPIERQQALDILEDYSKDVIEIWHGSYETARRKMCELPSAQPERLTDDDFETIRIHLNAHKERLCNQHRWEEAEEYERLIERFMAFALTEPERKTGQWIYHPDWQADGECGFECSECGMGSDVDFPYCMRCGAYMRGEQE